MLFTGDQAGTRRRHNVGFPPEEECSCQAATCLGSLCELGHCEFKQRKALAQLTGVGGSTKESKDAGGAPFVESKP